MTAGASPRFWRDRRVLLTGHTGFKGGWMALMLLRLGARVTGVALAPDTKPSFHDVVGPWPQLKSVLCDIRDRKRLSDAVAAAAPEIVIHMAAQALVRASYDDPVGTVETNVLGTMHLLDALRCVPAAAAILVITSDKVYENRGTDVRFSEAAPLGGDDVYSASKAAAELVTNACARSFFAGSGTAVCTARAGNVIGGGDWARDRIIPDLWRGYVGGQVVELRYPDAVRPWQHVLDPLHGYLLFVEQMVEAPRAAPRALNFGPPMTDAVLTVRQLAERFSKLLGAEPLFKMAAASELLPERAQLAIDASQAAARLGWRSLLSADEAVRWTCDWYKAYRRGEAMRRFSIGQIEAYSALADDG